MAKAKKKENLTPEERLQAALVPESEQPYKVPENWCWVQLGSLLSEIKNGTTIKQNKSGIGPKVTRIESLQKQTIDFDRLGTIANEQEIKDTDWYMAEDIALSHINSAEHVGKTALINADMLPLVHGMNLLRLRFHSECCMPLFFQYFSQSFQYKDEILSRINMAVNQVSINQKQLSSLEIPLPPLPEQQRIVDRIESLFAKLDEAKQKAQDTLDSFETRKAAILHKAFTGALTAQWRKEHGVGMESWEKTTMGEIASFHQGVQVAVDEQFGDYEENRVRFIRIVDYTQGTEKERYVSCDKIRNESYVKGDEIVMVRYGATAGFVGDGIEGLIANNMFVVDVRDNIREYIKVFLKSSAVYNKLNTSGGSTAMPALNFKTVSAIEVPLPSEKEQTEIVRILDDLLAQEQQAKEAAEAVLEQIDLIKKSILARAFRGELGTNDPAEESAVELLKQVL